MNKLFIVDTGSLTWPQRVVVGLGAILLVALGLVFGLVILGLATLAGVAMAVRMWWLRRRLVMSGKEPAGWPGSARKNDDIEAEYHIVERHEKSANIDTSRDSEKS